MCWYPEILNINNNNNKAFKSQTSWGRVELKPSISNQGSGTWIAVFQALLSKAKSSSKHSYLRLSLWVYSILSSLLLLPLPKSTSVFLCLSSRYYPGLGFHYALVPLEVSVGHIQTISTSVGQAFLQLVLPLIYHVYHCSKLDPFLYDRKPNTTYVFPRHLSVEHVVFS